MGVDPGSIYTGFGIVENNKGSLHHVASGRISAGKGRPLGERLEIIYEGLTEVVDRYAPEEAAIEAIFTHRNPRSALVLGHARGVALLALKMGGELVVHEYPPASVKQAVTGKGRAGKDVVQTMVRLVLGVDCPLSEDASDALAVAICHAQSLSFQSRLKGGR